MKERKRELWFERKITKNCQGSAGRRKHLQQQECRWRVRGRKGPDIRDRPVAGTSYSQVMNRKYGGRCWARWGQALGRLEMGTGFPDCLQVQHSYETFINQNGIK